MQFGNFGVKNYSPLIYNQGILNVVITPCLQHNPALFQNFVCVAVTSQNGFILSAFNTSILSPFVWLYVEEGLSMSFI